MGGLLAVMLFGLALLRTRHRYLDRQRGALLELLGVEGGLCGFAPGTRVRSLSKSAWLGVGAVVLAGEVVIGAVDEVLGGWAVLVPVVVLVGFFATAALGVLPSARVVAFTDDGRMHLVRCSLGWAPSQVVASVPIVVGNPMRVSRWVRKARFAGQPVRFSTLESVGEVPASV